MLRPHIVLLWHGLLLFVAAPVVAVVFVVLDPGNFLRQTLGPVAAIASIYVILVGLPYSLGKVLQTTPKFAQYGGWIYLSWSGFLALTMSHFSILELGRALADILIFTNGHGLSIALSLAGSALVFWLARQGDVAPITLFSLLPSACAVGSLLLSARLPGVRPAAFHLELPATAYLVTWAFASIGAYFGIARRSEAA